MKIFQLQSISNAITCIYKRIAVKNSGTSCLALTFNLSCPRMTISSRLRDMTNHVSFPPGRSIDSIRTHGLVLNASRTVTVTWSKCVRFLRGAETFCHPLAILRGTAQGQRADRCPFHIAGLSDSFFLNFFSGHLAVTGLNSLYERPTSTILEH